MSAFRGQYDLHGFIFDSDFPLDADRALTSSRLVPVWPEARPVRLALGDPFPAPSDVVNTLLRWEDTPWEGIVELVRVADGSLVLSIGDYRMRMSQDLSTVLASPGADRDMEWLSVLIEGWLVAIMVVLSGRTALHASSVIIDGKLVAFVGEATQGKSTLAAGLCGLGAQLFGDDVLAVDVTHVNAHVAAWADRGSAAIRLRAGAAALGLAALGPTRTVGDRTVVSPPRVAPARMPLGAIVIPWVSDTYTRAAIEWQTPVVAVKELMHYPRVFEWVDVGMKAQEFGGVAAVASAVPVGHLTLPAGDAGFGDVFGVLRHALKKV